jgi:hypothetical protein
MQYAGSAPKRCTGVPPKLTGCPVPIPLAPNRAHSRVCATACAAPLGVWRVLARAIATRRREEREAVSSREDGAPSDAAAGSSPVPPKIPCRRRGRPCSSTSHWPPYSSTLRAPPPWPVAAVSRAELMRNPAELELFLRRSSSTTSSSPPNRRLPPPPGRGRPPLLEAERRGRIGWGQRRRSARRE